MKQIKSAVSFFRKELGIKGKTRHNGRGFYDMDYDCTRDELESRIKDKIEDWCADGIVETVEYSSTRVAVRLKKEAIAGDSNYPYSTLVLHSFAFGVC